MCSCIDFFLKDRLTVLQYLKEIGTNKKERKLQWASLIRKFSVCMLRCNLKKGCLCCKAIVLKIELWY